MAKIIGIGVAVAAAIGGLSYGGYKLYKSKKGGTVDTPAPEAPAAEATPAE